MDHNDYLIRYVYMPMAALAGAVSSLGARRWRTMHRLQIALTILMGSTFAIFVTPWAAHKFVGVQEDDARAIVALTYLFGFGAFIILPRLTDWMVKLLGAGDAQ